MMPGSCESAHLTSLVGIGGVLLITKCMHRTKKEHGSMRRCSLVILSLSSSHEVLYQRMNIPVPRKSQWEVISQS